MPFRPPLSLDELRAIRERQAWNSDVMTLLWEVKRLRSLVLSTYQLWPEFQRPAGVLAANYDALAQKLLAEPCIAERDRLAAELLDIPFKPRKGMGPR